MKRAKQMKDKLNVGDTVFFYSKENDEILKGVIKKKNPTKAKIDVMKIDWTVTWNEFLNQKD